MLLVGVYNSHNCSCSADKPNCTITRKEINDEDTLVCMADGNPQQVLEFEWSLQELGSNETESDLQGRDSSDRLPANLLLVDQDFTVQRTYRCVATNEVGQGNFCELKVDGKSVFNGDTCSMASTIGRLFFACRASQLVAET